MSIKDKLRQRLELNQLSHQRAKSSDHEVTSFEAQHVLISRISPNPFQPRSIFAEHAISELAQSIEHDGLVQPIIVRPNGVKGYQLISGERRLRAFQMLGREVIPAIIQPMSDEESAIAALQENLKREDLTDFEVSEALIKLREIKEHDGHSLNVTEIAELISVSRPAVYRYLSFLSLPEIVRDRLYQCPALLSGSTSLNLERWFNTVQQDGITLADYEDKLTQVLDEVEQGLQQNKVVSRLKRLMAESHDNAGDLGANEKVKRRKIMRGKKQVGRWVDGPEEIKIVLKRHELNTQDIKRLETFLAELTKKSKS